MGKRDLLEAFDVTAIHDRETAGSENEKTPTPQKASREFVHSGGRIHTDFSDPVSGYGNASSFVSSLRSSAFARVGSASRRARNEGESKFIMTREILAQLDQRGDAGAAVQIQLARELAAMRTVADPDNREAGLRALAELRAVAKHEGIVEDAAAASMEKAKQHRVAVEEQHLRVAVEDQHRVAEARARGLGELHGIYMTMATKEDEAQQRGYDLEELLGRLFKLHDIPYQPPFRKGTVEQTDGFFTFNSFQYLIEARWRKNPPDIGSLRSFSGKVRRKIDSTRGLFVSVAGYRPEVVGEASDLLNLILMDGQDLALILEGRISLIEALQLKLDKAAQQGAIFYALAQHV